MEAETDTTSNQLDCTAAAAAAAVANGDDDADSCDAVCMQAASATSSTVSLFFDILRQCLVITYCKILSFHW